MGDSAIRNGALTAGQGFCSQVATPMATVLGGSGLLNQSLGSAQNSFGVFGHSRDLDNWCFAAEILER